MSYAAATTSPPRISIAAAALLKAALSAYADSEPPAQVKIILRNLYAQLQSGDAGRVYRACPLAIKALAVDQTAMRSSAVCHAIAVAEIVIDDLRHAETQTKLYAQWQARRAQRHGATD